MRKLFQALLLVYKRVFSPFIGTKCKFVPTCSMYTYDAIQKHGSIKGLVMGFIRVLRCNPFSKGGFQPVCDNNKGNIKWLI